MNDTDHITLSVRLPRSTYDALVQRQAASPIDVSLAAVARHLIDEGLGIKKKNGKAKR
jgi:hypothetical protein